MMKFFSVMSIIAFMIYLYVGITTYKLNKNSKECRIFLLLNISMAIWSFTYSFAYLAENVFVFSFWNKLSAIGWCLFPAFVLCLVLIIADSKIIKHLSITTMIFLPGAVFLFMSVFLFGPTIKTNELVNSFFYIGNFIYNFSYLLLSIIVMYFWGKKSENYNQKKQSNIIVLSSITPFIINLLTQSILPSFGIDFLPNIGQLYSLIMLWGVYYTIVNYQFMHIPSSLITQELFNEIMDLTFLIDLSGNILKLNKQVSNLLCFDEKELLNTSITNIIEEKSLSNLLSNAQLITKEIKLNNINLLTRTGTLVPLNLSIIPLRHLKNHRILGILIVGQDIRFIKNLKNEIASHKITSEKLKTSEELFRTMVETMPFSIVLTSVKDNSILYINTKTEELFKTEKSESIGKPVTDYFSNSEDRNLIIHDVNQGKFVKEREIEYKRKDNSTFFGLLTMVKTLYNNQEVLLSCVSDITERKNNLETLKKSKSEIEKINNELLKMNAILHGKSIRDGLTNLYNHQYINELLELEIDKANNLNTSICLLMLDIDFFKRVNDNFGHQIGDKVLVTLSNLIELNVGELDLVGRYGGEEFIVVLPGITLDKAHQIANKIRLSIQNFDFELIDLSVTISIGLTEYNVESSKSFINRADTLLYQAKNNGRNRIESLLEN